MRHPISRWPVSLITVSVWAMCWSATLTAERLPLRSFGLDLGLPSDSVTCIVADERGFMWFCTPEGLARFDGYEFRTYSTAEGLPHRRVTAFLRAADGSYWVGTASGVARFDPMSVARMSPTAPVFHALPVIAGRSTANQTPVTRRVFKAEETPVYALHQDRNGVVWCGTGSGLYRIDRIGETWTLVPIEAGLRRPAIVHALLSDRRGRLWIGTSNGLYRRSPDGQVTDFGDEGFRDPGVNHTIVSAMVEDREGRIWVGMQHSGLRLLAAEAEPGPGAVIRAWSDHTEVAGDRATSVVQRADGSIWWTGVLGLKAMRQGRDVNWADATVQTFDQTSGMTRTTLAALSEDQWGHLWLGGESTGVMRLIQGGFVTYTEADGLAGPAVRSITLARDGAIVVVTGNDRGIWHHNRFDGRRFEAVRFNMPHDDWGWGAAQLAFEDPSRRWWIPTGNAVFRSPPKSPFGALAAAPFRRYSGPTRHNWAIFRLFPDSHGSVWAGTMDRVAGLETRNELARWTRAPIASKRFRTTTTISFPRHSRRTRPATCGLGDTAGA